VAHRIVKKQRSKQIQTGLDELFGLEPINKVQAVMYVLHIACILESHLTIKWARAAGVLARDHMDHIAAWKDVTTSVVPTNCTLMEVDVIALEGFRSLHMGLELLEEADSQWMVMALVVAIEIVMITRSSVHSVESMTWKS
jgi:hypothetical protein